MQGFEHAVEGLNDLIAKNPELEGSVTAVIYSLCGVVGAYGQLKDRVALPVTGDDPYKPIVATDEDLLW